jgi:hypothetical protein
MKYAENPTLGNWVTNQQGKYRHRKLSPEREEKLESIDFAWLRDERMAWGEDRGSGEKDDLWTNKINELEAFQREYGHTQVPYKHKVLGDEGDNDEYDLGMWVHLQKGRKERLEKIGFVSTIGSQGPTGPAYSDDMFLRLLDFQKTHGHCQVPVKYEADTQLGLWVKTKD